MLLARLHSQMKNLYDLIISLILQTEKSLHVIWSDDDFRFSASTRVEGSGFRVIIAYAPTLYLHFHIFSLSLRSRCRHNDSVNYAHKVTSDSLIMIWRAETTSFHKLQSCLISIILYVNSHSISCSQPERDWYGQCSHKGLGANFICHLINSFQFLARGFLAFAIRDDALLKCWWKKLKNLLLEY